MMKFYAVLLAALLVMPVAAQAQDSGVKLVKPGETIISLNASEQMQIQQDVLQGSLRIEIDGKDPKEVQDKINKAMASALEFAKSAPTVKASTGQYYVYSYDPNPQPPGQNLRDAKARLVWKGSQTVDLNSKDSAALLELAGKIQEAGFVMNGLNYTLSPEQQEAYKDTLMVEALKKIQKRAEIAAKALGKSGYDIVELNVDGAGPVMPMPVMYKSARMEMASDAGMAAPVAQSGEQTVSLNINARILLKP
jgi:predicted secreted protein